MREKEFNNMEYTVHLEEEEEEEKKDAVSNNWNEREGI